MKKEEMVKKICKELSERFKKKTNKHLQEYIQALAKSTEPPPPPPPGHPG